MGFFITYPWLLLCYPSDNIYLLNGVTVSHLLSIWLNLILSSRFLFVSLVLCYFPPFSCHLLIFFFFFTLLLHLHHWLMWHTTLLCFSHGCSGIYNNFSFIQSASNIITSQTAQGNYNGVLPCLPPSSFYCCHTLCFYVINSRTHCL